MTRSPIQRLRLSNFRRLGGDVDLPFDAPVVLIHGSNGTGKTSILSALELALTGKVRSMERQSEGYVAHLPFLGEEFASVKVDLATNAESFRSNTGVRVSAAGVEGNPALSPLAAKFYAERCYLDQASLGRLLDLYQSREGAGQSALEEFVNELLGLEKLDALRNGLSDANDLRLLKRLAVGVDEADRNAKQISEELKERSERLSEERKALEYARAAARDAAAPYHPGSVDSLSDYELVEFVQSLPDFGSEPPRIEQVSLVHRELISIQSRVKSILPPNRSIEELDHLISKELEKKLSWAAVGGEKTSLWYLRAEALGLDSGGDLLLDIDLAVKQIDRYLRGAETSRDSVRQLQNAIEADREELSHLENRMIGMGVHSSALVEALSSIRMHIEVDNVCPVCDQEFGGMQGGLSSHVGRKLAEMTSHSERLADLRASISWLESKIGGSEADYSRKIVEIPSFEQERSARERRAVLVELAEEFVEVQEAVHIGSGIDLRLESLQEERSGVLARLSEEQVLSTDISRCASRLGFKVEVSAGVLGSVVDELIEHVEEQIVDAAQVSGRQDAARALAGRLIDALKREESLIEELRVVFEEKLLWDRRVAESRSRQRVAREVYVAANEARETIVDRVFTQSLNDVWGAVFSTLAPDEVFVPRFGVSSTTKKFFDINIETVHRTGEVSGPPQVMLSAGNLNTAALSLFLALHLAVDPTVPCLVFDDPVQAMDEVHVAQFAGLIRLLAKQNDRQVVIAVHERELFEYLRLELSPAYSGDELITIELGALSDSNGGFVRHTWAPDQSITG